MDIVQRLILVMLFMLPLLASAADEQIPASRKLWQFQSAGSGYTGAFNGPDPDALCTPWLAWYTAQGNSGYGYIPVDAYQTNHRTYACRGKHPNLQEPSNLTYLDLYVSCTGNNGTWVRQNSNASTPVMCTVPACMPPEVRQPDGSCALPPPTCEPGCNGACGVMKRFLNFRTRACIDQCIYRLGSGIGIQTTDGSWYYSNEVRENTGASCTPDMDNSLPDPAPCPECECAKQGKSWGTANGLVICHSPGTPGSQPVTKQDPPETKTETPAPTPENPNPEPVTTETPAPVITITPNPAGGSPDITETVTNPDGSTTSTTQSQSSYCQKNPTASVCKQADEEAKKGSWSGSCGAFQCEGDAVNCAIARKIHQDRCDDLKGMEPFADVAEKGRKILTGETDQTVTDFLNRDGDNNRNINVGNLVSESGDYQFGASCISDLQFSIGGHSITVPFSSVCPYFEMIGFFLLAAAYLAALRIVEVF